ncbi:hypothetical protein E2C01_036872 [Portunus trituberculatus]|uniref:Uncharacterized protein n=1 Tax=Portunus trituberculatus TaxID=210409 RepID=A0A5B7F9V8_PORTR|nr:hypothetical protein [Portunus trituberculatus]
MLERTPEPLVSFACYIQEHYDKIQSTGKPGNHSGVRWSMRVLLEDSKRAPPSRKILLLYLALSCVG